MPQDGTDSPKPSRVAQRLDSEVERALLGCCLTGGTQAVLEALDAGVTADDFCHPARARAWSAMVTLAESGRHVDSLSVVDELLTSGGLDEAGGVTGISALMSIDATHGSASLRASQVVDGARYRRLSHAGQLLMRSAVERDAPIAEIVAQVEEAMAGFGASLSTLDVVDRVAAAQRVLESAGKAAPGAIPTGFPRLDALLRGGLRPGTLVLVAARPAMGKTTFGQAVAGNIADLGIPVGLISLEMTGDELIEREIAAHANAEPAKWARTEHASRVAGSAGHVSDRPLHIVDRAGLTISEVSATARRLQTRYGIQALFVDHIGLVRASDRYAGNKVQEVAEVSYALRTLASSLSIPVIALSQLNRAVESRADKRPTLADLRDSGALEQDANLVMFLHRPEYYARENTPADKQGICEVIIAKNRGGPTDVVILGFDGPTTSFFSMRRADP